MRKLKWYSKNNKPEWLKKKDKKMWMHTRHLFYSMCLIAVFGAGGVFAEQKYNDQIDADQNQSELARNGNHPIHHHAPIHLDSKHTRAQLDGASKMSSPNAQRMRKNALKTLYRHLGRKLPVSYDAQRIADMRLKKIESQKAVRPVSSDNDMDSAFARRIHAKGDAGQFSDTSVVVKDGSNVDGSLKKVFSNQTDDLSISDSANGSTGVATGEKNGKSYVVMVFDLNSNHAEQVMGRHDYNMLPKKQRKQMANRYE